VSDQPPSQPPPEQPESDAPATLVPDGAPTEVTPAAMPPVPPAPVGPPVPAEAAVPVVSPPPTFAVDDPGVGGVTPSDFAPAADGGGSPFPADRPEIAVGAAFAGGLVLALILKRFAR
jgi:hypothetical protein